MAVTRMDATVLHGRTARSTSHRAALASVFLVVSAVLALPSTVQALTTITQGFLTKDKVAMGSIVSLDKNTADQVSASTSDNVESLLGVVVHDGNSLLALSSAQATQVQVATSGVVQVLVSDLNGTIKQGDQITASPIKGVGMKATDSAKVIGIAQGDLAQSRSSKEKYKDKDGAEHEVVLGEIPVQLNVSYYFKQAEKTLIPSAIQNVANALAGKTVKPLPIIVALAIFFITMMVVVSIIYTMIRSSIISIGRNPMSQSAVYRNLIQLSALVLAILGVAFVAIYMILTRF